MRYACCSFLKNSIVSFYRPKNVVGDDIFMINDYDK